MLCADRLDYTLRDGIYAGIISRQRAQAFLSAIVLKNDKIVLNAESEVSWINGTFKKLNDEFFKLPLYLYANGKMAELIKSLLKKGLLSENDLLKTDTLLLNKIRSNIIGYEAIKAINN